MIEDTNGNIRAAFEADAGPYGFNLARQESISSEPWSEYKDPDTGHRWAGWLAAFDSMARRDLPAPSDLPAPDKDGWIPWEGGNCPVPGDIPVSVIYRDQSSETDEAWCFNWEYRGDDEAIIHYKVNPPSLLSRYNQAKEEE